MNLLVILNVQSNPDCNGTSWVLLSRVIAMGLKEQNLTNNGSNEQTNEESEGPSELKSEKKDDHSSSLAPMTYIQYISWCRDNAIERGKLIQSTRLQLKYLALRCAITAIIECKSSSQAIEHSNLLIARNKTQELLKSINSSNKNEILKIPCYFSLFMNDLISMGCACAAFSIDDHRLLGLQTISIEYLQAIVDLFWNTLDPDDIQGGKTKAAISQTIEGEIDLDSIIIKPEKKILNQYMAQIISAIRPALSAEWSPNLLWISGNLIFGFISGGLLTDKIIIKRLIKSFLSVLESSNEIPFSSRCYPSLIVRSDIAIIQHINIATNIARIFLLSTPYCNKYGHVDPSIQETIRSSFTSTLLQVTSVWNGIIIDTARLLQGHHLWSKITPDTDCRRGGITYSPQVDCLKIYRYYLYSLPYLLAATTLSNQSLDINQLTSFLTITMISLEYLNDTQTKPNKEELMLNATETNYDTYGLISEDFIETQFIYQNIQTLSKPLLLTSFNLLLQKYFTTITIIPSSSFDTTTSASLSDSANTSSKINDIFPITERISILKYIVEELTSDSIYISSSLFESYLIKFEILLELFSNFLTNLPKLKTVENDNDNELQLKFLLTLWIGQITIARFLFSGMFSDFKEQEQDRNIYSQLFIFPEIFLTSNVTIRAHSSSIFWINNNRGFVLVDLLFKNIEILLSSLSELLGSENETFHLFYQYYLNIITTSLHYGYLYITHDPLKQTLFNLCLQQFISLEKYFPGELFESLMGDLYKWQNYAILAIESSNSSNKSGSGNESSKGQHPYLLLLLQNSTNLNEIKIESITDSSQVVYEMWLSIATELTVLTENKSTLIIPPPIPLALILFNPTTPESFIKGIILASLKYLQYQSNSNKRNVSLNLLTLTLIPSLLHFISQRVSNVSQEIKTSGGNVQTDILILQLFFLIFNLHETDSLKSLYLKTIMPTLYLIIKAKGFSDPLSITCGKGITLIARTSPQIFKTEIMSATDENKILLQTIMKIILEQQQQQQNTQLSHSNGSTGQPSSSSSPSLLSSSSTTSSSLVGGNHQTNTQTTGGLKKIDMSKFKKPTTITTPSSSSSISTSSIISNSTNNKNNNNNTNNNTSDINSVDTSQVEHSES